MTWDPHNSLAPERPLDYQAIFDRRGAAYHQAMQRMPEARGEEFRKLLELADLRPGETVCDFPSGGGYLARFLTTPVELVLLETSEQFLRCAASAVADRRLLVRDGRFPLASASVDCCLSMAGLHHVEDKTAVFREVARCLKPGGRFVLADAEVDSPVARFLDEFVGTYCETGHSGLFLGPSTVDELTSVGFDVVVDRRIDYCWRFDSPADTAEFCRLLFGLSQVSDATILEELQRRLGLDRSAGRCDVNWELRFLVGVRRGDASRTAAAG